MRARKSDIHMEGNYFSPRHEVALAWNGETQQMTVIIDGQSIYTGPVGRAWRIANTFIAVEAWPSCKHQHSAKCSRREDT